MLFPLPQEVVYPTSDGRPMAETDVHRQQMTDLIQTLQQHYQGREDVYVSGNLLMFYQEGDNRKHRSPDVMVVFGAQKKLRDNYKIWEEGKAPDLVFEITSRSTRAEDLGEKKGLYAFLGVQEYVIFDPLEEYLEPRLRLYRLAGEDYLPVTGSPLTLKTLNLELLVVEGVLRLRDPDTQRLLPTPQERAESEHQRAEAERERAEAERRRAEAAERELADLRRRLGEE